MIKIFNNNEANNALWMIGGRIIQMCLSFIVGILSARYLGPDNYGLINYGAAWVSFFAAISNLGINSVIIKEFIDYPSEQGKTIGSALIMRIASGIVSILLIMSLVCIIDEGDKLTITVVALCSIGVIFQTFEIIKYWFQAQYKAKVTTIVSVIAYIVTSVYKIILLMLKKDVRWFAFASSIDYIVVAISLCIAYKKHNGTKFSFSKTRAKSLVKKSYHYILSSMMVAIYGQTDKLMLKHMLNESEVGYYAIATGICAMWVFVLSAIIDSMYPTILKYHKIDKKLFEIKNRQLYAIVFYISCFVSTIIVLLGDWGINLLYGKAYSPAGLPLKIVTWYTAFSYLGVARNAWIISEGKQKYLKYMYFGAALMNVVLNYIFIPVMGAAGAAAASLITQISTSIILPACFREMRPNAVLMIEAILLKNITNKEES